MESLIESLKRQFYLVLGATCALIWSQFPANGDVEEAARTIERVASTATHRSARLQRYWRDAEALDLTGNPERALAVRVSTVLALSGLDVQSTWRTREELESGSPRVAPSLDGDQKRRATDLALEFAKAERIEEVTSTVEVLRTLIAEPAALELSTAVRRIELAWQEARGVNPTLSEDLSVGELAGLLEPTIRIPIVDQVARVGPARLVIALVVLLLELAMLSQMKVVRTVVGPDTRLDGLDPIMLHPTGIGLSIGIVGLLAPAGVWICGAATRSELGIVQVAMAVALTLAAVASILRLVALRATLHSRLFVRR